jgi:beta-glucanase (GH16 family)
MKTTIFRNISWNQLKTGLWAGVILLFFIISGCSTSGGTHTWVLVWSDEFNGTGNPEPSKWESLSYNRRNNDSGPDGWWSSNDAYLSGTGNLILRVRQIPNQDSDGDSYDYSCGMVRSRGRFEQRYGKFEIRCKMPTQPGWWVAFWLMADSVGHVNGSGEDGTEIDIMEGFGWTETMQHALHWDGYGTAHQSTGNSFTHNGLLTGFHTFTLEWYESLYIFYVDGQETWRTVAGGVSKVPEYIKISGEISTESWAVSQYWANDPALAIYPDYFTVDYVRVYKQQ